MAREDAADVLANIYIGAAAHYAQYGDIASYSTMTWSSYLLSQPAIREYLTVEFPILWGFTSG